MRFFRGKKTEAIRSIPFLFPPSRLPLLPPFICSVPLTRTWTSEKSASPTRGSRRRKAARPTRQRRPRAATTLRAAGRRRPPSSSSSSAERSWSRPAASPWRLSGRCLSDPRRGQTSQRTRGWNWPSYCRASPWESGEKRRLPFRPAVTIDRQEARGFERGRRGKRRPRLAFLFSSTSTSLPTALATLRRLPYLLLCTPPAPLLLSSLHQSRATRSRAPQKSIERQQKPNASA